MIKAKPFEFGGYCSGCEQSPEESRGGANVVIDEVNDDGWICLKCAEKLAACITKAVTDCRTKIANGLEYKHDRWQKKAKPKAAKPLAATEDQR